jgi:hypothetical protein
MQEHSSPELSGVDDNNVIAECAEHFEEIDNLWVKRIVARVMGEGTLQSGAPASEPSTFVQLL